MAGGQSEMSAWQSKDAIGPRSRPAEADCFNFDVLSNH